MKQKNLLNIILNILLTICLALGIYSGIRIFKEQTAIRIQMEEMDIMDESEIPDESIIDVDDVIEVTEEFVFDYSSFQRYKNINSDFIGYIRFDSGLISLPIVQTDNNDYYLNHSIKKNYSSTGTPFFDYKTSLGDANMTIYGHYVYSNPRAMFSPLHDLLDKEKFEENSRFNIYYEDSVVTYKIVYALIFDINDYDSYNYDQPNFLDEEEFNNFIAYPKKYDKLETGEAITYNDNFVTLQTCVRNQRNKRLLVLAKQVRIDFYD